MRCALQTVSGGSPYRNLNLIAGLDSKSRCRHTYVREVKEFVLIEPDLPLRKLDLGQVATLDICAKRRARDSQNLHRLLRVDQMTTHRWLLATAEYAGSMLPAYRLIPGQDGSDHTELVMCFFHFFLR